MTPQPSPRSPLLRRRLLYGGAALLLLLVSYSVWLLASIHSFGHSTPVEKADCAIVLGAAAYHNRPSPVFEERIKHAITLYRKKAITRIILTGGFGKSAPYSESGVAKTYAIAAGIPETAILVEEKSATTAQNLIEAAVLMREYSLESALVVSDPWHLKRACTIARDQGILAHPSATLTTRFRSRSAKLKFLLKEFYNLNYYYLFSRRSTS